MANFWFHLCGFLFVNFLNNYTDIEINLNTGNINLLNKKKYNWNISIIKSDENTNKIWGSH